MKWLKIIACCMAIVLIVIGCISFKQINTKYPQKKFNEYQLGQYIDYEGYSFCVESATIYKYWDFKEKYSYSDVLGFEAFLEENDTHFLMINLKIRNDTLEEIDMPPITYFTIQSVPGAYSSVVEYHTMKYLYNDDISFLEGQLAPNEEVNVLLPYAIDAAYLSFYDGDLNVDDFIYVISLYPEKNYVIFE